MNNFIILEFKEPWFNNPFKPEEETPYEIFKHSGWIQRISR